MAMNKVLLRKQLKSLISGMSASEKERQSRIVFDRLVSHPKYKLATRLSIYLSTDNEIDTRPILRHALEVDGKQCFVPFVKKPANKSSAIIGSDKSAERSGKQDDGSSSSAGSPSRSLNDCPGPRMIMVRLSNMLDYERLPVNGYGIKEHESWLPLDELELARPTSSQQEEALMLCIVPAMGFASDGRRIGHGRGYYDEFLFHWSSHSAPIYTIGLAFSEQMIPEPCSIEGHDFQLDEVIWPDKHQSRNE